VSIQSAYQSQLREVSRRLGDGERIAGYKIGCVSAVVRAQLGLTHPVFGHVFAGELHVSGCELDASGYRGPAVEGEFAVRIGKGGSIGASFPVIELHHYTLPEDVPAAEALIASNAMQAGVVLPGADVAGNGTLEVWINGECAGRVELDAVAQAGESVDLIAAHLNRRGIALRPGDLLLTGSPLPLYRVASGDHVEVRSGGAVVTASFV
jgi:2-keto-4-pentenoate hydratase